VTDVIFSAFDERTGPVAIYSTIKDPILTKKIAVKSIISTLTSVKSFVSGRVQGEAIIPFPDEDKSAFIFYATLDQKTEGGEHRVISLSAVVENEKGNSLYSKATVLSQVAAQIKDLLNSEFTFGQPITENLTRELNLWGSITEKEENVFIAEREVESGLQSLLDLFSIKKRLRNCEDPLVHLFFGLLGKIPIVLIGPNIEILLEITNLLKDFIPEKELNVSRSIDLNAKSQIMTSKIPRADIVLLDEAEDKKKQFYKDPVITIRIGRDPRFINYNPPKAYLKTLERIFRKTREFEDELAASHYLQGEILAFSTKLQNLKEYCLTGRQINVKEIARNLSVDENYIRSLAEALRTRMEVSADELNNLFLDGEKFEKIEIRSPNNIGYIR
jgi:hypothetical protein